MENLFYVILIAAIVYPLSFIKPRIIFQKRGYLIVYISLVSIALSYLIIMQLINRTNNFYFVLFLAVIACANIFKIIKKRKILNQP